MPCDKLTLSKRHVMFGWRTSSGIFKSWKRKTKQSFLKWSYKCNLTNVGWDSSRITSHETTSYYNYDSCAADSNCSFRNLSELSKYRIYSAKSLNKLTWRGKGVAESRLFGDVRRRSSLTPFIFHCSAISPLFTASCGGNPGILDSPQRLLAAVSRGTTLCNSVAF